MNIEAVKQAVEQISQDRNAKIRLANGHLPDTFSENQSLDIQDLKILNRAASDAKDYFDEEHLIDPGKVMSYMLIVFRVAVGLYSSKLYQSFDKYNNPDTDS